MPAKPTEEQRPGTLQAPAGWIAFLLLPFVFIGTVLTLTARHWWLADLIANLRVQLVLGVIATAVLFAVARRRWWLMACFGLLAVHVPSFMSIVADSSAAGRPASLTVLTVNVLSHNPRHKEVLEVIRESDADLVAVLEITTELAGLIESRLGDRYPHRIDEPHDIGNFGIAVYSKLELKDKRIIVFNDERLPSIEATVTTDQGPVRFIATHTLPPMSPYGFAHRNQHLTMLAARVREANSVGTAVLVVGDLNLTPWSPNFAEFTSVSGLHRATRGSVLTPTWYRFNAFPFGLTLDHCLASEGLECVSYSVGNDIGSDHRPVLVGLATRQGR